MKTPIFLFLFLCGLCLPLLAQQPANDSAPDSPAPQKTLPWEKEFNALDDAVKNEYIRKFMLADNMKKQGIVVECLRLIEDIQKIYDGNPGLFGLKGACYIEIRDFEKALEYFRKAAAIDPDNGYFAFNLAETYFLKKDYEKAAEGFKDALTKLPKDTPTFLKSLVYFKLYICYLKTGQDAEAEKLVPLYDFLDDVPYYYCVQSVKALHAGDRKGSVEAYLSAVKIYQGTEMLKSFLDTMKEADLLLTREQQNQMEDNGPILPL